VKTEHCPSAAKPAPEGRQGPSECTRRRTLRPIQPATSRLPPPDKRTRMRLTCVASHRRSRNCAPLCGGSPRRVREHAPNKHEHQDRQCVDILRRFPRALRRGPDSSVQLSERRFGLHQISSRLSVDPKLIFPVFVMLVLDSRDDLFDSSPRWSQRPSRRHIRSIHQSPYASARSASFATGTTMGI